LFIKKCHFDATSSTINNHSNKTMSSFKQNNAQTIKKITYLKGERKCVNERSANRSNEEHEQRRSKEEEAGTKEEEEPQRRSNKECARTKEEE